MTTSVPKSFSSNVCFYGLKWKLVRQIINLDYSRTGRQSQISCCKCAEAKNNSSYKHNTSTKNSFLLLAALHEPDEEKQKYTTPLNVKLQNIIRMSLVLTNSTNPYLNK